MSSTNTNKTYGVFAGELHEHAGAAIAMGVFVGSSWAVAAVIACSLAMLAEGTAAADLRWILSIVFGMLAGGILQQLWFNFRPALHMSYGGRIAGFGISYFLILRSVPFSAPGCSKASPGHGLSLPGSTSSRLPSSRSHSPTPSASAAPSIRTCSTAFMGRANSCKDLQVTAHADTSKRLIRASFPYGREASSHSTRYATCRASHRCGSM